MRTAIVLLMSGAVLVAAPAHARNGAWYVGGDFGATIVEDVDFDFGGTSVVPGTDSQIVINHDYGYDGALFVGYDLGAFRIEAEVAYKRASVDDIETAVRFPGMGTPVGGGISPVTIPAGGGRTSALSFMINGMLDFGDDDGISGFVGGGAGVARVDYSNLRAFENQPAFIDDSDTRFAWQVVAGVRQAVSNNVDVHLRYRFFNVSGVTVPDIGNFDSESRFRSHSIVGGITFDFGGPTSPSPP